MEQLREALPDDAPAIHALITRVYREYGFTLDLGGIDAHLRDPATYFRVHGGTFWVVDSPRRIVATVGLLLPEAERAELKSLYVDAAIRRKGWGQRLIEHVTAAARHAQRHELILWSDTRFADAHRLYARLGFVRIGERALHDKEQTREFGYCKSIA